MRRVNLLENAAEELLERATNYWIVGGRLTNRVDGESILAFETADTRFSRWPP